jgi:hypothetical protein
MCSDFSPLGLSFSNSPFLSPPRYLSPPSLSLSRSLSHRGLRLRLLSLSLSRDLSRGRSLESLESLGPSSRHRYLLDLSFNGKYKSLHKRALTHYIALVASPSPVLFPRTAIVVPSTTALRFSRGPAAVPSAIVVPIPIVSAHAVSRRGRFVAFAGWQRSLPIRCIPHLSTIRAAPFRRWFSHCGVEERCSCTRLKLHSARPFWAGAVDCLANHINDHVPPCSPPKFCRRKSSTLYFPPTGNLQHHANHSQIPRCPTVP